ncbi:unnamed protein product, partial [marine sediment metagenome]
RGHHGDIASVSQERDYGKGLKWGNGSDPLWVTCG